MLRLGRELARGVRFSAPVFQRALASAQHMRDFAEREGVAKLVAVGTSAMREAENGRELRDGLSSVLGVPVRILSGREEARVIFDAIRARLALGRETTLGLDLGGGSLEFALGDARGMRWDATLPAGVVRLQGQLIEEDRRGRIPLRQLDLVRERVRKLVRPLRRRVGRAAPARVVVTGGTVRALARLASRGRRSDAALSGLELDALDLNEIAAELARDTRAERLQRRGMTPRRVDLLPVGAAVLAATLFELELPALRCCDWGLREGLALEVLGAGPPRGRSRRR